MRIVHVVGARPNFPKLAPVYKALESAGVEQSVVHTGQHFDREMSQEMLDDLGMSPPDINLAVGSGSHASQTAAVLQQIEPVFVQMGPDAVVVYGDVNSTVAAALAASKLHVPVIHVESGLRSFDDSMPEEINRKVTDVLSSLLLTTSQDAGENLMAEGRPRRSIKFVGNPMIDSLLGVLPTARRRAAELLERNDLQEGEYALVTMHRPANVDGEESLNAIVALLEEMSDEIPIVFPAHPRVRTRLERSRLSENKNVRILAAQPYATFIGLIAYANVVITDSGGVQEESTVLGVPCLTLRPNTERPVTITHGTNRLVSVEEVVPLLRNRSLLRGRGKTPALWDGMAGSRISDVIVDYLGSHGG